MEDFSKLFKNTPECFAIPTAFDPLSKTCNACEHKSECRGTLEQLLRVLDLGLIDPVRYSEKDLKSFNDALNVWKKRSMPFNCRVTLSDLQRIHYKAINFPGDIDLPDETFAEYVHLQSIKIAARSADDEYLDELLKDVDDSAPPCDRSENSVTTSDQPVEGKSAECSAVSIPMRSAGVTTKPSSPPTPATTGVLAFPSAVSTLSKPMGSTSATTYSFPMPTGRPYDRHTNAELAAELKRLVDRAFHSTPALGYAAVRGEFCAIHIEMNLRQQHAPRFRPIHRMKQELSTDEERAESLDRQVIDIHWRAHSSNKPASPANNYPTIFNSAPFDVAAAERFAQEVWPHPKKAIHLHLTEDMQWENAILQSSRIRQAWAVMQRGDVREGHIIRQEGAPQIEQRLRESVHRANKPQIVHSIPGMVDAWKARQIAGNNPARIARLIALMSGNKQRDRKAVMHTLDSLDKYLGKKAKARSR